MNEWPYVPCSCGFHHVPRACAVWLYVLDGTQRRLPWSRWCAAVVIQARGGGPRVRP